MTQRWTFTSGSTVYVLDRNPNESNLSLFAHDVEFNGREGLSSGAAAGWAGSARAPQLNNMSFSGTINSKAAFLQYTQLFKIRNAVTLVDHLNRTWTVRFTKFTTSMAAPERQNNVWRQSYSVDAVVLGGPS